LLLLTALGLAVFLIMFISLLSADLSVYTKSGHILYHVELVGGIDAWYVAAPYLAATLLPFVFVRSIYNVSVCLGLFFGASAIASYLMYSAGTFPSTWCFFAAWLSTCLVAWRIAEMFEWARKEQQQLQLVDEVELAEQLQPQEQLPTDESRVSIPNDEEAAAAAVWPHPMKRVGRV
jgi:hypothetical protein